MKPEKKTNCISIAVLPSPWLSASYLVLWRVLPEDSFEMYEWLRWIHLDFFLLWFILQNNKWHTWNFFLTIIQKKSKFILQFFFRKIFEVEFLLVWKHFVTSVELSKETQMYESMFFESQKTLELDIEKKRFLIVIKHQCENFTAIAHVLYEIFG